MFCLTRQEYVERFNGLALHGDYLCIRTPIVSESGWYRIYLFVMVLLWVTLSKVEHLVRLFYIREVQVVPDFEKA